MAAEPEPHSRLGRRLSLTDAVVVGLGSMLGAGVFAVVSPAAAAAGPWLLAGLAIAALVAWCNATSSAALAARHPQSGGAYVYGRQRLGPAWGVLAGAAFIVGKTASCAAMAITFAAYAAPDARRPAALAVVAAVLVLNLGGVTRTVAATRVLVAFVLAVLVLVVLIGLVDGSPSLDRLDGELDVGGVLESAGLLFFAFAGYARIATLGEEVRDPATTIPRAIPLALGAVVAVYAVVLTTALLVAGDDALASSIAPLTLVAPSAAGVVRVGAAVASLGVLVALLAGVGRTAFAMAADGVLPRRLAGVNRRGVPAAAEIAVALGVATLVLAGGLRGTVGLSSACVLTYYAVANAAALRLRPDERIWPRSLAVAGLGGCALLAVVVAVRTLV